MASVAIHSFHVRFSCEPPLEGTAVIQVILAIMSQIARACPWCGAFLIALNNGPMRAELCCGKCGWNISGVRKRILRNFAVVGVVAIGWIASLAALLVRAEHVTSRGWLQFSLVSTVLAVFCIQSVWNQWQNLKWLEKPLMSADMRAKMPPDRAPESFIQTLPTPEQTSTVFGGIANLDAPRKIKMTMRGKIWATVAILTPAAFIAIAYFSSGDISWEIAVLIYVAVFLTMPVSIRLMRELRKKRLIRDGREALGRIVSTRQQPLYYAFADSSGCGFVSRATDFSGAVQAGAPTLIFYDPAKPDKNVCLDNTWWTIDRQSHG
jgi:ribosomal protein S27AE